MSATLVHVFGYHTNTRSCLIMTKNNHVLFLAGKLCVHHNIPQNQQKFVEIDWLDTPTAVCLGPKKVIAVADLNPGPRINIYDTEKYSHKEAKKADIQSTEYVSLCFSTDNRFIIAQGGAPDWAMPMWSRDKLEVKNIYFPTDMLPGAEIVEIRFHPNDNDQIIAIGKKYLRLYKFEEEEGFKPYIFAKQESEGDYFCTSWMPKDRLAVSSSNSIILFFDGIEQRQTVFVTDDPIQQKKRTFSLEDVTPVAVTCLVTVEDDVLCVYDYRVVFRFRKTPEDDYIVTHTINLPEKKKVAIQTDLGEVEADEEKIIDMKMSPDFKELAIATSLGQILYYTFEDEEPRKDTMRIFNVLTQPIHKDGVVGLDIAVRRSTLVTCSEHTMCIWNYVKRKRLMCKNFYNKILCVAIHPFGLHIVIGFSDYAIVYLIITDGLKEVAVIPTQGCFEISFSHGGQALAVANKCHIEVYHFITLEVIVELRGHHGKITNIRWNSDDTRLITSDDKGIMYIWDLDARHRIAENVKKDTSCCGIAVSPDGKHVFIVASDCTIREVQDSDVIKECPTNVIVTALVISSEGDMLFGGTEDGCLRCFVFPLTASASAVDIVTHLGKCSATRIIYGDQQLVSCGEDGMICIWNISDAMKRPKEKKKLMDFSNIWLVDKEMLRDYLEKITKYQGTIDKLKIDTLYQLSLKKMHFEQDKRFLHSALEQEVIDLNIVLTKLSDEKIYLQSLNKQACIRIELTNKESFVKLERQLRERMGMVFTNCDVEIEEHKKNRKMLGIKLRELQNVTDAIIEELETLYYEELRARNSIVEMTQTMVQEKEERCIKFCEQIEVEVETEIANMEKACLKHIENQEVEIMKMKENCAIVKKRIVGQKDEIRTLNEKLEDFLEEEKMLNSFCSELRLEINKGLKVIEDKNSIITELQEQLFAVQQRKQCLEMRENVLSTNLKTQMVAKKVLFGRNIIVKLKSDFERAEMLCQKKEIEIDTIFTRTASIKTELKQEQITASITFSMVSLLILSMVLLSLSR